MSTMPTVFAPLKLDDPKAEMLSLGKAYELTMNARIKTLSSGLVAIHDELCKLCDNIRDRQKALLIAHPELMLLAL